MTREELDTSQLGVGLPPELEAFLQDTKPRWTDPVRPPPPLRRWLFERTLRRRKSGFAPVTGLRGPAEL
jgi:hypothetical protein